MFSGTSTRPDVLTSRLTATAASLRLSSVGDSLPFFNTADDEYRVTVTSSTPVTRLDVDDEYRS